MEKEFSFNIKLTFAKWLAEQVALNMISMFSDTVKFDNIETI